jgi:hypothetical protein
VARNPDSWEGHRSFAKAQEAHTVDSVSLQEGQVLSRRTQIVVASVILLIVGTEVAVRLARNYRTGVEIANDGDAPIENLVVSFGGSRVAVGQVAVGESTRVWLSGAEKGSLSLSFNQTANPLSGFLVPDFDPLGMRRDGLRMVLHIKPNEVMKFMDDEVSSSPLGRLREQILDWVSLELHPLR